MQAIIFITTLLMLIKIAYIDYKQKIIPDRLNEFVTLLGILNLIVNFQNCKVFIASAAITFTVFLLLAVITDGGIGGGDIKLFTALSLIFGSEILVIIVVTFTSAAIFSIPKLVLKRINIKENIALAPFICFAVISIAFMDLYIS